MQMKFRLEYCSMTKISQMFTVYSLNYLNEIKVNTLLIKDTYVPFYRSKNFNQFISKCLVKNPDSRPTAVELLEVSLSLKYSFLFAHKNYLRID